MALTIIALLVAAAFVYVGSRPTKLPPPFGVARNGLITYAVNGDVYTAEPTTGVTKAIVTGDALDRNPIFSRDGTRVAFLRQVPNETGQFHLAVVARDGGAVTVVTTAPIGTPELVDWSPDSSGLIVNTADAALVRYDLARTTPPTVIAERVHVQPGAFRPPDGAQILYQPDDRAVGLWVMNADGTARRLVFEGLSLPDGGIIAGSAAWSPDGRLIAFGLSGLHDENARIHVINADGTGLKRLDQEAGTWVDNDLVWSPDGAWIAFNRWRENQTTLNWDIMPIGVVSVAGGPVRSLGPTPVPDGALFGYSPDGTSILSLPSTLVAATASSANDSGMVVASPDLIDAATGESRRIDVDVSSGASWQRLAP